MKIHVIKIFLAISSLVTISFSHINEYISVDKYYKDNVIMKNNLQEFTKQVNIKNPKKIDVLNQKEIKIYMVYPGQQVSDYWRRSKASFEKRLQSLGIKYKLVDYFTKPSIEISKQAKALQLAIQDDADYLIFTLDAKKHLKFIYSIVQNKKPKIILQNITTPLKSLKNNQVFFYVGFDHEIGGRILAKKYIEQVGTIGNYAVMYGPKGYVSHMRGESFNRYIKKYSNLKLVDSYYTNFDKTKAKKATLDLLENHNNIDFIYACSTDIALGVVEALKEKKLLGKVKVNGWGGGSKELEAIINGELDFTVMRINDDNGVAMAEAIKLDQLHQINKLPLVFSGKFEVVEKGISKERLKKLKQEAFRCSGE